MNASASFSGRLSATSWNGVALAGLLMLAVVGGSLVIGLAQQAWTDTATADEAQRLLARATPEEVARTRARAAVLKTSEAKTGPQPSRPSDIVRAFHSAASAMHIDLVSIRPVPDPDSDAAWTLHLEFAGSYNDIGFFLSLIEQAPVGAQVRRLRLEPSAPGSRATTRSQPLQGSAETYVVLAQRPSVP